MPVLEFARVFHAFFSLEHVTEEGSSARQAAENLWQRVGFWDQKMESVADWPREMLFDWEDVPHFTIRAARRRPTPLGSYQALVYTVHDTLGITVIEAPNDSSVSWRDLDDPWQDVLREMPEGVLGSVRLYLGLIDPDVWNRFMEDGQGAGAQGLGEEMNALVPGVQDPGWALSWCRLAAGPICWELPPAGVSALPPADRLRARRVLAVARPSEEDELDGWFWTPRGPGMAPFTRHLLHAAKMRRQRSALYSAIPAFRQSAERIDAKCDHLSGLLEQEDSPAGELVAADRFISRLQTEQSGLITQLGKVRDMAESVRAAESNMVAAWGGQPPDGPGGPLECDEEISRWMLGQLRIEETHLTSAQTKATEISRLTALMVTTRLQKTRENLLLFQTTLLGALLTVLAAGQSLGYDVPIPQRLEAPLIAVFGALALLLPPAVVRWPRAAQDSVDRWSLIDHCLAGSFGATISWLAVSTASLGWSDKGAPWPLSLGVAALGAFLTARFSRPLFSFLRRRAKRNPSS